MDASKHPKVYDESGGTAYTFGGMAGGPGRPRDHLSYDSDELFSKIFGEAAAARDRQRREEEGQGEWGAEEVIIAVLRLGCVICMLSLLVNFIALCECLMKYQY